MRARAGPARGVPNGPVSSPSPLRGQPIRLRPNTSWIRQFNAIQADDAATRRNIHCRASGVLSMRCCMPQASSRNRTVATAWTSERRPPSPRPSAGIGSEQMTSQPHHVPATHSQGVRSQAQSRKTAERARKQTSATPIAISATPCACISSSGSSMTLTSAVRFRMRTVWGSGARGMRRLVPAGWSGGKSAARSPTTSKHSYRRWKNCPMSACSSRTWRRMDTATLHDRRCLDRIGGFCV